MSKKRLKLLVWLLLVGIAAAGLWLVLNRLANLLVYFQRGADPASALNIVPNLPPDLHVAIEWQPDDPDTGREIEPFTRTQLEAAYLRAWLQWNISYLRNEPYGLETYFVGPALASVTAAVTDAAQSGLRVAQVDTSHTLKLHFYSADGSIASFTDTRALVAQSIRDAAGNELFTAETAAAYDVVMFLEEGNWRVRHWVRRDAAALDENLSATAPQPSATFVSRSGMQLVLDGEPFEIAGINYYPQATPWDEFWPNYDPEVIDRDFAIIRSLGLNTVRIFIPFEQFGGPEVDPLLVEQLDDLLERAGQHGLKVIVTLFDFRTDYSLLLWPNADRQLETLLTRFKDNPNILAWDLKNEPDRDYAASGRQRVNGWLAHTARLARTYDPNHLLTIGWSTPEAAHALPELVDLVSFHYYAPAAELSQAYSALRAAVGDRPIVLQEFGLPTWNSFFFPHGHSRPEQAQYYADILATLRENDAAGYLAWTLYDFTHVPSTVAGRYPWQTGPQKHLGVLDRNGATKPAAALLAPNATLDVPRVPGWARFLKPFWLTVFAVSAATLWLALRFARPIQARFKLRGGQS